MGMVLDMKESKKESFFPAHIYPHKHSSSLSWLPSYNKTKLISSWFHNTFPWVSPPQWHFGGA